MSCECMNWARVSGVDLFVAGAHHSRCPKFETEVRPRLFYYEEAESCWCPAPDKIENIVGAADLDEGEDREIQFKRVDMTDAQMAALPVF